MDQQDLNIGAHLKTLWKGKWLILLTTVIALGGVVAFADNQPEPTYRAVATIKVDPVGGPAGVNFATQVSPADRNLNTYILLLQSRNVMDRALRKLGVPEVQPGSLEAVQQVEELRTAITVRSIPNANLLEVTARGETPQMAQGRANAVISAFIDYVKEERTRTIEEAMNDLDAQISASQSQGNIDDLLTIVIPDLGGDINGIVWSVEQSIQTLEQLQPSGNPDGPRLSLREEIPRLQQASANLGTLARSLQRVQVRLEEGRSSTSGVGGPSLSQEASRLEGTITDLDLLYRDLQAIRSQVDRSQPAQNMDALIDKIEEVRTTLRLASQQLDQVRAESPEQARQINEVRLYIDSVASDLQTNVSSIRSSSADTSQMAERDKSALQGKIQAHTLGLTIASDDLRTMRAGLDLSEYAKIITARGHVETANNRLRGLNTELDSTAGGASVYDSITEIMNWTQGARRDLQAVSASYLQPQVAPGTAEERNAAIRAVNDISSVSLALELSSSRARNLSPRIADPLLQARLNAVAGRLTTTQRNTAESSARLQAIGQVGNVALASQIRAVRERVQDSADGLLLLAQELDGAGSTSGLPANLGEVGGVYTDPANIAWSLDVASRQLDGALRGNNDPLFQGEVGSLQQQLTAAQREVQSISERLAGVTGGRAGSGIFAQLALIADKLAVATGSLMAAADTYRDEREDEDGLTSEDVARIKESIDISAAIIGRVGDELSGLQGGNLDSYRFGQLVVLVGRVRDTQQRAAELSYQLQSLQGNTNPEVREMRQLKRQLELSLLHPQETGITQVDSAVSPQAAGRQSFISQAMVPMAGLAGVLLGSLGVLLKSQMDPTFRSQTQMKDRLGLASLGVIPKGKPRGNPHPPMVSIGDQPVFSEALQLVGTSLTRPINSGIRSLLITSPGPKEGKTMLAVNLAHVLAQHGHKVLLVDGNLRKPEVAEVLDLPDQEGLATALAQQTNALDYVVECGAFHVLPGGKAPNNPVELLSSPAMLFFLQQAQNNYNVVLVDGPPTLGFAEIKAQSQGFHASILVIRAGVTKVEAVEEAKAELEASGIPVAASVLNFAPSEECHHLRHEKYIAGSKGKKVWPR